MIRQEFNSQSRELLVKRIDGDLIIVGGGMAGVCAAITAAREGVRVVLVQDRPMLGGNGSSEVRLWVLGATSHMGNNNRWSREGGVIDEILVENTYKNPEGNPIIFDTVLLDKVRNEKNITLLLNTSVDTVAKSGERTISQIEGFCSQNSTRYIITSSLFCDCSGDGIVGYLAGASFSMGAESREEFNEGFAPTPEYGNLLGHSLYFYSRETSKPVKFIAPDFALKDMSKIPRLDSISGSEHGCKYWWLEYGGRLDTIYDTEEIKWELWKIVYGVWDHIKNSGRFENVENLTLEWVGTIAGKRESRRFNGHYVLKQQDIIRQSQFEDRVAYGGWAIDLHPSDGVYSPLSGCTQYHSKGIYEIPMRCFVSRDIDNLFFAGRCICASHVAHGSTRVMATSAYGAQAVGMAAKICIQHGIAPATVLEREYIKTLQQRLNLSGQSIPRTEIDSSGNLLSGAKITASSELVLDRIDFDGPWYPIDYSVAQMLPVEGNHKIECRVDAACDTTLTVEIRRAESEVNYTPEITSDRREYKLKKGVQTIEIPITAHSRHYVFVTFLRNQDVAIRMSNRRFTGLVSVFNKFNKAVNNHGVQTPPPDIDIDSFEFWTPERRPAGNNIAMAISPAIDCFSAENLKVGIVRPTIQPNAWIGASSDLEPTLEIEWDAPQKISTIKLFFDTDYDNALESVQMGSSENVMPFCVREYEIKDDNNNVIYKKSNNYQTINNIVLDTEITTRSLTIKTKKPTQHTNSSIFHIYLK